ncbi:MAG: DUF4830 domain-containing protein [Ruminococcaceae bacterium]|nr:DUF4830 domain-containing protein [Oscillospiraceae bacterium]
MKVYFMLSRNGFIAIISAVVLAFLLLGTLKIAVIPEIRDGITNESRVNYLLSLGHKVSETPVSFKETVVPNSYGAEYEKYLSLQTKSGFPLSDYKGNSVQIYEYEDDLNNRITLIVADGKIIGGHICSAEVNEIKPLQIKG